MVIKNEFFICILKFIIITLKFKPLSNCNFINKINTNKFNNNNLNFFSMDNKIKTIEKTNFSLSKFCSSPKNNK